MGGGGQSPLYPIFPALAPTGENVTFYLSATPVGSPLSNPLFGIWSGTPGDFNLVGLTGTPGPGTASGTNYSEFGPVTAGVGSPAIANNNDVIFNATLKGPTVTTPNATGIWAGRPGSVALVARQGDPAPGLLGVTFSVPFQQGYDLAVNSSDQVAFDTSLTGPSVATANDGSLWVGSPGNLAFIAPEGDQAPGLAPGTVFSTTSGSSGNPFFAPTNQ